MDLVKSVKERMKSAGRTFSFFDDDRDKKAQKRLQSEESAVKDVLECVAENGPRGEALALDLSQFDQRKLKSGLKTCRDVAVTIDGRAAIAKGELFYALREALKEANDSNEPKASHPVWKKVAACHKPKPGRRPCYRLPSSAADSTQHTQQ